jgi:hypothetical protein
VAKEITQDHNNDGINRRGFLESMVWAGKMLPIAGIFSCFPAPLTEQEVF